MYLMGSFQLGMSLGMRVKCEGYNSSSYNHFNLDPIMLNKLKLFNG